MAQDISYLIGSLGIASLLGLSAYGSCEAMAKCGAAAALHAEKQNIITVAYIAMIMISTVFFYAFILSVTMMNQVGIGYTFHQGISHLLAGMLFGVVGMTTGLAMGKLSKESFRRLFQNSKFFSSFLISLVSLEVVLILAFLCSLMILFKH